MADSEFSDTSIEAEQIQLELLRQAPPWRKFQMLAQLNQTAYTLALSGLRRRYPEATPAELRRRLADLLLGEELAHRAYGSLVVGEEDDSHAR
jgi:hypothetical protein